MKQVIIQSLKQDLEKILKAISLKRKALRNEWENSDIRFRYDFETYLIKLSMIDIYFSRRVDIHSLNNLYIQADKLISKIKQYESENKTK